jgi:hypothetical protein
MQLEGPLSTSGLWLQRSNVKYICIHYSIYK